MPDLQQRKYICVVRRERSTTRRLRRKSVKTLTCALRHLLFTRCSLVVQSLCTRRSLAVHSLLTRCSLAVRSLFTRCSLAVTEAPGPPLDGRLPFRVTPSVGRRLRASARGLTSPRTAHRAGTAGARQAGAWNRRRRRRPGGSPSPRARRSAARHCAYLGKPFRLPPPRHIKTHYNPQVRHRNVPPGVRVAHQTAAPRWTSANGIPVPVQQQANHAVATWHARRPVRTGGSHG